jgi:site-specific DNA-methyltransferase (adenine-specific)
MQPYYADDSVTIYHGDCREVMRDLDRVDMIFTDPPYGMAFQSHKRTATPRFAAIQGDAEVDTAGILAALDHLKDGGAAYVATRWDVYPRWYDAIETVVTVKNCIVWAKSAGGLGDLLGDYLPDHEWVIYAVRGRHVLRGGRVSNVWQVDKDPPSTYLHPMQKPVGLASRAIQKSSDAGDLVLDPYMGSGSSLRAAKDLGRRSIGIEIEERYCEVAAKRCAQEVLAV